MSPVPPEDSHIGYRDRVLAGGALASAFALLAAAGYEAQLAGLSWWVFVGAMTAIGACSYAVGTIVVGGIGLSSSMTDGPLLRALTGLCVLVCLNLLLAFALDDTAVPLILAVISGLAAAISIRAGWMPLCIPSARPAVGWLSLTSLLVVGTASPSYVASLGSDRTRITQPWDTLFHLAFTKAQLRAGFPLVQHPLVAGAPPPAYHPAFDTFVATLARAFAVSAESSLYALSAPLNTVFLIGALCVAAWAISRSATAAVVVGGLVTAMMWFPNLPFLPAWFVPRIGAGGIASIKNLLLNYPSGLAAGTCALAIALVASKPRVSDAPRVLIAASLLLGATVAMKANAAIAFVPAWALTLLAIRLLGRIRTRALLIALAGLVLSFALFYLMTKGAGAALGVHFGEFSRFQRANAARSGTSAMRLIASALPQHGPFADTLFFLTWVAGCLLSWRGLVVVAFVAARRGAALFETETGRLAWLFSALAVAAAVVVGLTVVQPDTGRFTAWNIAGHTMHDIVMLSLLWAAVALGRAVRPKLALSGRQFLVGTAVTALSVLLATAAMPHVRQTGDSIAPTDFYRLVARLPEHVPPDGVVMQNFDVERDAWVSGIGGRQVLIERAETQREYVPSFTISALSRTKRAYEATNTADLAADGLLEGISHAVVGPDDGVALRHAGVELDRSGGWVLLALPAALRQAE